MLLSPAANLIDKCLCIMFIYWPYISVHHWITAHLSSISMFFISTSLFNSRYESNNWWRFLVTGSDAYCHYCRQHTSYRCFELVVSTQRAVSLYYNTTLNWLIIIPFCINQFIFSSFVVDVVGFLFYFIFLQTVNNQ